MRQCFFGIVSFTLLAWGFEARGEDWPMWRGPRGDGIGKEADVPTTWSDTENIHWKSSIPGDGRSSPIVCMLLNKCTFPISVSTAQWKIPAHREAGFPEACAMAGFKAGLYQNFPCHSI